MVIIEEVEVYTDGDGKPLGYASVRYRKDVNDEHGQWQAGIPLVAVPVTNEGRGVTA